MKQILIAIRNKDKTKEIDKILKDNTAQHSRKKLELYKPALLSNEPSYRKCHRVCGE